MVQVSVIIPNYNHGKYLTQRIESVLNQTYSQFEVIIFDDCSTDNSREIIERYRSNPKISHIIYNNVNSGSPFKQWKKGTSLARGSLIWVAESDDVSDPNFLHEMIHPLMSFSSVGVSFCQSHVINDSGTVVSDNLRWTNDLDPDRWKDNFILPGREALTNFFIVKNIIPNVSTAVFRKDIFEKIPDSFSSYKYAGDWLVWAQILQTSDVHYTSLCLNYWRIHPNVTRIRKSFEKSSDYFKEVYSIVDFIKKAVSINPLTLEKVYNHSAQKIYSQIGLRRLLSIRGYRLYRRILTYDPSLGKRLISIILKKVNNKFRQPRI